MTSRLASPHRATGTSVGLLLPLLLLAASCTSPPAREVELARLEESVVAPCCWRETLATHDSGPARELRAKVRERFERGDSPQAILADLEATHGPNIRAAPRGFSWSWFGAALLVVPVLGGLVLLTRIARRAGAAADESADEAASPRVVRPGGGEEADRALEDRLDDEIAALD